MLYELAADMERRSDDLGERSVVTLDPTGGRIVVEVNNAQEAERGHEFFVQVMADYDLA